MEETPNDGSQILERGFPIEALGKSPYLPTSDSHLVLLPSDVADQSNNASTTLSQMQYPIHVSPADAFAGQQVDGSDFHLSAGVQHEQQAKQQYGSVNGIDQIHQSATYMQQVSSSSSSTTLSPMTSAADANHLATISGNLEDFPRAQFGMDSGLSTPAEVISPPLPAAENISPLDTPVVRGVNVADMNAHDVITQRMNGIAFVERHIGDQPMGHETGINENTSHVSSESTSDASVPKVGSSNSQNEHQSRDVLTDEHTPVVSSQMPLADHMQAENQPSQALHNAEDFSHEMNDSMSRHGHYGSFIDTPTGASTYLGVGQGSPQKMHQSQSEMRAGASMADTSTNDLLSGENPAQHASLAGDINPSVLTMQYQQPVGEGRTNNPLMATSMEVKPDNMASEEGSVYVQPNSMQLDSIRVHAATSAVTDPNILSIDGMSGAPHESIPHDALQREHMMLFQHSMNAESMHLMQQQHMVQAAQAHAQAEIQRMLQNPGLAAASSHGQHGLMPMPTSADLFMGVPHEYTPYATSAVADMRNVKQDNPQEATANAHPGAKHPQLIYPASNPFNIHANELRYMAGPEHPGIHRLNSVAVSASSGVSQHIDAISKRQTLPRRHTVSSPYASNAKAPPLDMPEMPMSAAPHVRHDLTRAGLGHDDSRTASFKKAAKRRQSLGHLNLPPPPSIAELASLVAQRSSTGSSSQAETATLSNLDQLTKQELIEKVMQYEREKQSAMTTANSDSSSKDLKLGQLSTTDGSGEDEEDAPLTPMDTNEEAKDEDRLDDGAHSPTSSTPNSPALSSKDADEREDEEDDKHVCKWKDCQQEFPALESLISHVGEVHIGSGKNAYYCQWEGCVRENKPFTKRHKMFNHLRTHTGERPFMCPMAGCGKRFSRPDSLTTHIKTHSNVRPFVCPVEHCGKAYYHSRSLRKHEKTHESGRNQTAHPYAGHPYAPPGSSTPNEYSKRSPHGLFAHQRPGPSPYTPYSSPAGPYFRSGSYTYAAYTENQKLHNIAPHAGLSRQMLGVRSYSGPATIDPSLQSPQILYNQQASNTSMTHMAGQPGEHADLSGDQELRIGGMATNVGALSSTSPFPPGLVTNPHLGAGHADPTMGAGMMNPHYAQPGVFAQNAGLNALQQTSLPLSSPIDSNSVYQLPE